jgi:hypothetical protein
LVCKEVEVDLKEMERWSINDGMSDRYEKFIERLNETETG